MSTAGKELNDFKVLLEFFWA